MGSDNMPELPEVETVKETLKRKVLNKTIKDVRVIYPNIIELLFFVFVFVFACIYGGVAGFIVSSLVLFFFAKGYYDMMGDIIPQVQNILGIGGVIVGVIGIIVFLVCRKKDPTFLAISINSLKN